VGGSVRESLERHVRFSKIVYRHEPRDMAVLLAVGAAFTLAGALVPGPVAVLATVLTAAVYAYFGVRRWTVLLAYPAMMLQVPLFAYGMARRTFVWGGRRYRWPGKFDVRIVE
jgi:hypothetical protein